MPLPINRPFKDVAVTAVTTSIATAAVAANAVAPKFGLLERVMLAPAGTTTGTIIVTLSINGGTDVLAGALTVAAGTGARAGTSVDLNTPITVNEGDFLQFNATGGTGTTIPGVYCAVIR